MIKLFFTQNLFRNEVFFGFFSVNIYFSYINIAHGNSISTFAIWTI